MSTLEDVFLLKSRHGVNPYEWCAGKIARSVIAESGVFRGLRFYFVKDVVYYIFHKKKKRIKNIEETLLCWKIETTH